ncbi:SDR family oxidoreductase [Bacillus sp. PS06]|uniref:SDR family oxidoreductase n=1 Tax=Bacillus sp. PS06 TaxID=2764176 RepID=UPI001785F45E|nr:SDR family oxidoreductase [Bacillus sp. PS06]MBD8067934.1 SDR family oxidoreductase [Bacillus sp. PS06]
MDLHLNGKAAIVIASSQGLGKAIATQLAMEGVNVMLSSRNSEKLESTKQEIESVAKGRVSYASCDITNVDDIKALVAKTKEEFGKIDILINNAGGPPGGGFDQFEDADWQKAFELNLLSYVRIIREVLPDLKEEGGRIINIASSSIKMPIPGLILSNTFRMGIVGLAKSLAEELAPYNILVNTVAPGRIATDRVAFLDQLKADKVGKTREEVEVESKQNIPLGRYGKPEEFAKVVTFLASDASSYVTGSSLLVDGGMVKSI